MLKAGIVGCGRIGSQFDDDPKRKFVVTHAGAYSAIDGVELVAACDLNREELVRCGQSSGKSGGKQGGIEKAKIESF